MAQTKTIIILGTGNSCRFCDFNWGRNTRELIPNSEVWGVNGTYTMDRAMPPRFRKFFRTHKLFMTDTMFSHEQGTLSFSVRDINKFANKYHCEIISLHKMKLGRHVLNAKPYPYRRVSEYFDTEYFTDTICYMLAYALYKYSHLARNEEGVVRPELDAPLRLRLFGIDMSTTREYQQSKGGVEFWLGVARGMGAKIEVAPGGTILQTPCIVPYGQWGRLGKKVLRKDVDPLGIMQGKEPTTADADKLAERLRNEEGNTTPAPEWHEFDKQ